LRPIQISASRVVQRRKAAIGKIYSRTKRAAIAADAAPHWPLQASPPDYARIDEPSSYRLGRAQPSSVTTEKRHTLI